MTQSNYETARTAAHQLFVPSRAHSPKRSSIPRIDERWFCHLGVGGRSGTLANRMSPRPGATLKLGGSKKVAVGTAKRPIARGGNEAAPKG